MAKFNYDHPMTNECAIEINIDSCVNGYVRLNGIYIPNDVIILIQYFYGIIYKIYHNKPNNNEIDDVIHLLKPVKQLGITMLKNKKNIVRKRHGIFARNNITVLSKIIQINNTKITDTNANIVSDLITDASKHIPSFFVFRTKKEYITGGYHFRLDITNKESNEIFPYYKFDRYTLDDVCSTCNGLETMDIYANKKCINHKYGINVFMFIKCDVDTDISDTIADITDKLQNISGNLECTFVTKKYAKRIGYLTQRYYSVNKGKGPLRTLVYCGNYWYNDTKYWCCVLIDQYKMCEFRKFKKPPSISLNELSQYGHIILSKQGFHIRDHGFRESFTHDERQLLHKLHDYFEFTIGKLWREHGMKR